MCGRHHSITLGHIEITSWYNIVLAAQFVITCLLAGAVEQNIRGSNECEMEIVENSQNAISATRLEMLYFHNRIEFIFISFFALDQFSF